MKIRNFFLIVSLLGIFAQPPQPVQQSVATTSPAISATQEVWRTYTKVTSFLSLAIQNNYL
jgi:hypothetical protein